MHVLDPVGNAYSLAGLARILSRPAFFPRSRLTDWIKPAVRRMLGTTFSDRGELDVAGVHERTLDVGCATGRGCVRQTCNDRCRGLREQRRDWCTTKLLMVSEDTYPAAVEPAPDLEVIVERLKRVQLDPWGPDGVRYVSILFMDDQGYRALRNALVETTWPRWDETSGEFWDLFWAGCYRWRRATAYGDRALRLTDDNSPVYWSPAKSAHLISEVQANDPRDKPWKFHGPLEFVVFGARRAGNEIDIDWRSMRSTTLRAEELGTVTANYTESHIRPAPDALGPYPAPGDFSDDLPPRKVLAAMARKGPQLLKSLGAIL